MTAPTVAPPSRERAQRELDRLVSLAHEHLGLGVVYVAEFVGGRQVYRALAGDAPSFGLSVGGGGALDDSYCARMVAGTLPNAVPDTAREGRVRDLAVTSSARIGAYLGVPLRLPDGDVYGTLCALSHEPQPDLNVRDAKFLSLLADFMVDGLASERAASRRREMLSDLIRTRSMTVALQPIVDLHSGACVSLEALARFPTGLGSPDRVFREAEQAGLQFDLERLAVQRAVERLPSLRSDQSLAVNVSPAVAFQLMPLVSADRPLHQLVLEITEHAAVEDYAEIRQWLQPLRERGLRLAIDDAGAGYASLRHVVELRPDIIKVDRSLVAGLESDAGRRSAFTTFALLALDVGAVLIAEGVETAAELDTVVTLGADAAQGYLLGRPSTDPEDLARWTSGEPLLPVGEGSGPTP